MLLTGAMIYQPEVIGTSPSVGSSSAYLRPYCHQEYRSMLNDQVRLVGVGEGAAHVS